jgi:hypothetical protein
MNWKEPFLTFSLFIIFLYSTLKINAEYGLSCILFILVFLSTRMLIRRKLGLYKKYYIEEKYFMQSFEKNNNFDEKNIQNFVPYAVAKINLLGFLNYIFYFLFLASYLNYYLFL